MAFKLPRVAKKLKSFLSEEDGNISKQIVVVAGMTAGMATAVNATCFDESSGFPGEGDSGYLTFEDLNARGELQSERIPVSSGSIIHYHQVDYLQLQEIDLSTQDTGPAEPVTAHHAHCVEYHHSSY